MKLSSGELNLGWLLLRKLRSAGQASVFTMRLVWFPAKTLFAPFGALKCLCSLFLGYTAEAQKSPCAEDGVRWRYFWDKDHACVAGQNPSSGKYFRNRHDIRYHIKAEGVQSSLVDWLVNRGFLIIYICGVEWFVGFKGFYARFYFKNKGMFLEWRYILIFHGSLSYQRYWAQRSLSA